MANNKDRDELEKVAPTPGDDHREAHSLEDAVDSRGTLEGYFAMNNIRDEEERQALELEAKQKKTQQKQDDSGE